MKYLFIVIAVVGVLAYWLTRTPKESKNYDQFAQCLAEKKLTMYGAYWCSHCQNEKKAFGDSFKYVPYIECTQQTKLCLDKGIEGYPTWIINGVKVPGEQKLETLSRITGCNLE